MVVPIELPQPPEPLSPPPPPPPPSRQQQVDGRASPLGLREGEGWMCLRHCWSTDTLAGEVARRRMLLRTAMQEGTAALSKMDAAREFKAYTQLVGTGKEARASSIRRTHSIGMNFSLLTQLSSPEDTHGRVLQEVISLSSPLIFLSLPHR